MRAGTLPRCPGVTIASDAVIRVGVGSAAVIGVPRTGDGRAGGEVETAAAT